MARVREGAEVIIENDACPVAILRSAEPNSGRLLSESIALAEAHAKELGHEPTMDPDFAGDLEGTARRGLKSWVVGDFFAESLFFSCAS